MSTHPSLLLWEKAGGKAGRSKDCKLAFETEILIDDLCLLEVASVELKVERSIHDSASGSGFFSS